MQLETSFLTPTEPLSQTDLNKDNIQNILYEKKKDFVGKFLKVSVLCLGKKKVSETCQHFF